MNARLLGAVAERLGVVPEPPGLGALRRVYAAWCLAVPFDNLRKMIALRTPGAPLPGLDAEDFFESWLAHGTGGTCWTGSNALHELLRALGFEARRVAGSMRDTGDVTHASVKVRLEGRDWLVDSSVQTNEPLPLTDEVFVKRDPVFGAEVERDVDGRHVFWIWVPTGPDAVPCRLLVDPAPYELYAAGYEASRAKSPFNQRLYARRNRPGEQLVISGATRYSKTAERLEVRELSRGQLLEALRGDFGFSGTILERWAASGALDDSLQPPSGPRPPVAARRPPSARS